MRGLLLQGFDIFGVLINNSQVCVELDLQVRGVGRNQGFLWSTSDLCLIPVFLWHDC